MFRLVLRACLLRNQWQWADAWHLYGESDAPALHESPAALQVGLGKSKAKGVNPDRRYLWQTRLGWGRYTGFLWKDWSVSGWRPASAPIRYWQDFQMFSGTFRKIGHRISPCEFGCWSRWTRYNISAQEGLAVPLNNLKQPQTIQLPDIQHRVRHPLH